MKKTSLFLLLFVSMSSFCAMDEVGLEDLRTKVNEVASQGSDMRDLMERADRLKDSSDRFNNAGQNPKRSLFDRLLGRNKSSGSQAAPRAIRGSEEASTFGVGGSDTVTEKNAEQDADTSAGRGLSPSVSMDENGNISFGDEDKGTWDWGSNKNSRRMDALNDLRNKNYSIMDDTQKSNLDSALRGHAEQTQKSWWMRTFTSKGRDAEKTLNNLGLKDVGAQFKPGERNFSEIGISPDRRGKRTPQQIREDWGRKIPTEQATKQNSLYRTQEISGNLKNNTGNFAEAARNLAERYKNKKWWQ